MDWIGFAALVLSFVLWLFNPAPLRRLLGLEKPAPPPPVYAAGMQDELMRLNREIDEVLTPEIVPLTSWVSVDIVETEIAKGKRPLTTRIGSEIRCQAREGELVLMRID